MLFIYYIISGDELEVLRGIKHGQWAGIRQVVMEVCDRNGRLEQVVSLLRHHGYTVACVQQDVSVDGDYLTFTPKALWLFYVYATRR